MLFKVIWNILNRMGVQCLERQVPETVPLINISNLLLGK